MPTPRLADPPGPAQVLGLEVGASPNGVPFASVIASSSVSKQKSSATGPKVSSEASAISIVRRLAPSESHTGRWGPRRGANTSLRSLARPRRGDSDFSRRRRRLIISPISRRRAQLQGRFWRPRRAARGSAKASWTQTCARMRFAQTQVLAPLRNFESITPSTARSRSASLSKTIKGKLQTIASQMGFAPGATTPSRVVPPASSR